MTGDGQAGDLVPRSRKLAELAERRLSLETRAPSARERARQLRDHLVGFVLPRANDIDAPIVVAIIGPTGAGKSSLLNAIAGAGVSRAGVIRPTTRDAVLYATPEDARGLAAGRLRLIPAGRLVHAAAPPSRAGIAVIDAPDIDSIERENRVLADTLLEICDLCIFVTTATRYADLVPWHVLDRLRQRGVPLIVVLNRLPPDAADREVVIADARRLFAERAAREPSAAMDDILTIGEGDIDAGIGALARDPVMPIIQRIDALAARRDERRALATEALAGAIRGLAPLVRDVAADLDREADESDRLRVIATEAYGDASRRLSDELHGGMLLRAEVLRQWQEFVGADQIARFMSSGLGRLRGLLLQAIRGTPAAPIASVEEGMSSATEALALRHASEAARRTARLWSEHDDGAALIERDASLWSASPELSATIREALRDWMHAVIEDVRAASGQRHAIARVAAIGVNAVGVAVMLAVFAHTAGITGTELGIAAGTAFVNQKLLEAIFGERAMDELVSRAGRGLDERLAAAFARDRGRFDALVPEARALRELSSELRATIADL